MRSSALIVTVLAAALIVAPNALLMAEEQPGAAAALLAMSTIPPTGATAAMIKNGNVRFAPNVQAKVVVTMKVSQVVEIIGRAPATGWWAIRFPRFGRAWVDMKNLAPEGIGLWRVIREGTRAREDATLGSSIVRELAKGEIIQDAVDSEGRMLGPVATWRPVYIPNAVAYVHESTIELAPNAEGALHVRHEAEIVADSEWVEANRLYIDLYREVTADISAVKRIDWAPLNARLDRVIAGHRSADVRLKAQVLKQGVAEVIAAADGLIAVAIPNEPVKPKPPVVIGQDPIDGSGTATTGGGTSTPMPAKNVLAAPAPVVVVVKPAYPGQGILETKDYSAAGVAHHLTDANGKVVALLKPKLGSPVQFSEFVWREVGAKGTVVMLDPEATGLSKPVPLIEVDELVLVNQR